MSDRVILEVDNLFAGYEGHDVLHGVSLSLIEGEILGVVGPNGSGKSTLLRAITQGIKPHRGSISVRSEQLSTYKPEQLARTMGVVPQSALLPEGFTALEVALMGRTPYLRLLQSERPEDFAIARRSMFQTDTLHLSDRPTNELSGGERQRVIVARALTQQAPILLLDEPTVHLDVGQQHSLLDLVRDLARNQSLSVIAVIHDLTLAAQYCDRLTMLHEGRMFATGAVDTVLDPEKIRSVYDVEVRIIDHPDTGRPVVLPVPGYASGVHSHRS